MVPSVISVIEFLEGFFFSLLHPFAEKIISNKTDHYDPDFAYLGEEVLYSAIRLLELLVLSAFGLTAFLAIILGR